MRGASLTREELVHYAPIDAEVAAYVVDHVEEILGDKDDGYDPAGCFDDGWIQSRTKLAELYDEDIEEQLKKYDDDDDLSRLLMALQAEFEGAD